MAGKKTLVISWIVIVASAVAAGLDAVLSESARLHLTVGQVATITSALAAVQAILRLVTSRPAVQGRLRSAWWVGLLASLLIGANAFSGGPYERHSPAVSPLGSATAEDAGTVPSDTFFSDEFTDCDASLAELPGDSAWD